MRKKLIVLIALVVVGALLLAGAALAEDGDLFRRNISKTPDAETEKAAIYMMDFYVPGAGVDRPRRAGGQLPAGRRSDRRL